MERIVIEIERRRNAKSLVVRGVLTPHLSGSPAHGAVFAVSTPAHRVALPEQVQKLTEQELWELVGQVEQEIIGWCQKLPLDY